MQKNIMWSKWKNPVEPKSEGDDEDNERSLVRVTPFGLDAVRLTSSNKEQLRWYCGHTNFNISAAVGETIKRIEGVEILEVFSRYRFRICPGKHFLPKKVLRDIKYKLCQENNIFGINDDLMMDITKKQVELTYNKDPWLMYVLPNGKFECFSSFDQQEYLSSLEKYDHIQKTVGGVIITS